MVIKMNINYELDLSRLKKLRINKGLTQEEISSVLNIERSTYSRFENGKATITMEELNILSNYYNVSLDYLCKLSDNIDKPIKKIGLDKKIIGENLKKLRKEKRLYQGTIAQMIGTGDSLISEYESGKRLISLTYGYAICKKFNYSMDKLYGKEI